MMLIVIGTVIVDWFDLHNKENQASLCTHSFRLLSLQSLFPALGQSFSKSLIMSCMLLLHKEQLRQLVLYQVAVDFVDILLLT